jgi:peptide/nickel transport system substrate-binding protein
MKASIVKTLNVALIFLVAAGILLTGISIIQGAEKPRSGGTFVVGMHADPAHLNPTFTAEHTTRLVTGNIYSRLVYLDLEGNYVGDLAEKWVVSPDNLRIRFDLRQGAKWHDGRPVTAEDVKFTLESLAKYNPKGPELKRISEITVLTENSLEVKFPSPSVTFFSLLDDAGFIIPKHIYGASQDLTTHPSNSSPIGSGPFAFVEWRKGDHITLTKNKSYYIPGEAFVDKAIFRIIPSAASRVLALETGDLDYLAERALPGTDVARLRNNPKFRVTDRGMGSTALNILIFNTRRKPWNDVRVRRAVAHAIDRRVMVEKGTFGLSYPGFSSFSKISYPWAYNPKTEEMYPLDLEKAAKLLDEAGYPVGSDGVRFKTTTTFDRGDVRSTDIAEVLRQQLKKVGIDIVMQAQDKASMIQRVFVNYDFDLFLTDSGQGSDPSIGIERYFVTDYIRPVATDHNANEYSNPEVDKLFKLGRTTVDRDKRGEYYREVQIILLRDLPTLTLVDNPKFAAFPKKVRGVNERRFWSHLHAPSDGWFSE